jgi:GNAT superfamily N-acetyltransferase
MTFGRDPAFDAWQAKLAGLESRAVSIRAAVATPSEGRRVWDLQVVSEHIWPDLIMNNVKMIGERTVLLAEINSIHVGLCVAKQVTNVGSPLYLQVVCVAEQLRGRGVGLALLGAAATRAPERDIVFATQDDNAAARALTERFAQSIGATMSRERIDDYRPSDLGFRRGQGYRVWKISRPSEGR